MDLKSKVSRRVKSRRMELGLTQKQLADQSQLNVRYISRLENAPQNITLNILERVSKGLGCTVADLVLEFQTPVPPKKSIQILDQAIHLLSAFRSELKTDD